jgi:chromosome segregation ATPase
MSLSEDVAELEDDYERLKADNRSLEESLDDAEQDLETTIQQRNQLQEFKDWVEMAYPEIIKDYGCVKIIEEKANECC